MCNSVKQNFKSINNTLQNIIQKYNLNELYVNQTIQKDWNTIVNKNISKIVKPVKIEKQVLYLQAKTEYWKAEFDVVKNQIMEAVNKYLDPYRIKEINII